MKLNEIEEIEHNKSIRSARGKKTVNEQLTERQMERLNHLIYVGRFAAFFVIWGVFLDILLHFHVLAGVFISITATSFRGLGIILAFYCLISLVIGRKKLLQNQIREEMLRNLDDE